MPTSKNPSWSEEELILALDFYVRLGAKGASDPAVAELSSFLNKLPVHADRPDAERFRNPNGVALKLANFQALDPRYGGTGMQHGARLDAVIWDRFSSNLEELASAAQVIREWSAVPQRLADDDPEAEALEGRLFVRAHRALERSQKLARSKKEEAVRATGRLACEACGFDFAQTYGELGQGFIECHHRAALSRTGPRTTKLSDLALLCSNCHRMAHRGARWPTVEELKGILRSPISSPADASQAN